MGKSCLTNSPADLKTVLLRYPPWALLPTRETARLLEVDPNTLAVWRWRGLGPPVEYRKDRQPRYSVARLVIWLAERGGKLLTVEDVDRLYLSLAGFEDANRITGEHLAELKTRISAL